MIEKDQFGAGIQQAPINGQIISGQQTRFTRDKIDTHHFLGLISIRARSFKRTESVERAYPNMFSHWSD